MPRVFLQGNKPDGCLLSRLSNTGMPSSSTRTLGFDLRTGNLHEEAGSCLLMGDLPSQPAARRAHSSVCGTSTSRALLGPGASCCIPLHPAASCHLPLHPAALSPKESSFTLSSCAGPGETYCLRDQPSLAHIEMAPKCKRCGLFSLCPLTEYVPLR